MVHSIGDVVAYRYRIRDVVGSGGTGVVYRAFDEHLGLEVALKIFNGALVTSDEDRRRLARQTKAAKKLTHQNCVRIYDDGFDAERPYFTMQFLDGLSLRRIIGLRHDKGQVFTLPEIAPIFSQLCQALDFAHQTTFHGNLKPDNVIVMPDLLKVTDFALLRGLPRRPFLAIQRSRGHSIRYLAPEVRREAGDLDRRIDIFSIGVILAEMVTGEVLDPTAPGALSAALATVPAEWAGVIRRALSPQPQERFQTAGDLYRGLRSAISAADSGEAGALPITAQMPLPAGRGDSEIKVVPVVSPPHGVPVAPTASSPAGRSNGTPAPMPSAFTGAAPKVATVTVVGISAPSDDERRTDPSAPVVAEPPPSAMPAPIEVTRHHDEPTQRLDTDLHGERPLIETGLLPEEPSTVLEIEDAMIEGESSLSVEYAAADPLATQRGDDDDGLIDNPSAPTLQPDEEEDDTVALEAPNEAIESARARVEERLVGAPAPDRPVSGLEEISNSAIELVADPHETHLETEASASTGVGSGSSGGPEGNDIRGSDEETTFEEAPSVAALAEAAVPGTRGSGSPPVVDWGDAVGTDPIARDDTPAADLAPPTLIDDDEDPTGQGPLTLGAPESAEARGFNGVRGGADAIETGARADPATLDDAGACSSVPVERARAISPPTVDRPGASAVRVDRPGASATDVPSPPVAPLPARGRSRTRPMTRPRMPTQVPMATPRVISPDSARPPTLTHSLAVPAPVEGGPPPASSGQLQWGYLALAAVMVGLVVAFGLGIKMTLEQQRQNRAEIAALRNELLKSGQAQRPTSDDRPPLILSQRAKQLKKREGPPAAEPVPKATPVATAHRPPPPPPVTPTARPDRSRAERPRRRVARAKPSAKPRPHAATERSEVLRSARTRGRATPAPVPLTTATARLSGPRSTPAGAAKVTVSARRQPSAEARSSAAPLTAEAGSAASPAEAGPSAPTAKAGSAAPTAEAGSSAPTAEAGSSAPTAKAGSSAPTAEAGPSAPTAEAGPSAPTAEAGPSAPTAKAGPSAPTAEAGRSAPTESSADAPPIGQRAPAGPRGPALAMARVPVAPAPPSGPRCPKGMALVEGGPFMMGSLGTDPERNFGDLAYISVEVDPVCVDAFEFPNRSGRRPSAGVTWKAAASRCRSQGKRLCTEAEWEKACKGPQGFRYAYGNAWDPGPLQYRKQRRRRPNPHHGGGVFTVPLRVRCLRHGWKRCRVDGHPKGRAVRREGRHRRPPGLRLSVRGAKPQKGRTFFRPPRLSVL